MAEEPAPDPVALALDAAGRGDVAALRAVADDFGPQVWKVAEGCLQRDGGAAGARALAEASRDVDREALARYVASRGPARHAPEVARRFDGAREALRSGDPSAALPLLEGIPESDTVLSVEARGLRGDALAALRRYEEAQAVHLASADAAERVGWTWWVAGALRDACRCAWEARDVATARVLGERRLAVLRARGDARDAAEAQANLASVCAEQADYPRAFALFASAIADLEAGEDLAGAAMARANLGLLHARLGAFARALSLEEEALRALRRLGRPAEEATVLGFLGSIRLDLGQHERATEAFTRALALADSPAANGDLGVACLATARAAQEEGDAETAAAAFAEAEERLAAAVEAFRGEGGDRHRAAVACAQLADVCRLRGQRERALAHVREALRDFRASSDPVGAARLRVTAAQVEEAAGGREAALGMYRRAYEEARAVGAVSVAIEARTGEAALLLQGGEPARALAVARDTIRTLGEPVAGLAHDEAAAARAERSRLYETAVAAAAEAGNPVACAEMLDAGRAGALLAALGGREALQAATLPPVLASVVSEARAREGLGLARYRAALAGDESSRALRRREWEEARRGTITAQEEAERAAKSQARAGYPLVDPPSVVRSRLEPGEVLVLYALPRKDALAVVVTSKLARIVRLGPSDRIRAACDRLLPARPPHVEPGARAEVRALLIDPLRLPADTTRVLISPDGLLAYVPFAYLLPERDVALVPSATAYGFLRSTAPAEGTQVLALGDPDYGAARDAAALALHGGPRARLTPLPASRTEVLEIGDVRLLAGDATEARLRRELSSKRRWRSVHLACHGHADTEQPALSALALTATPDDDGFWTALEVYGTKVPADLVVLSACETARGRIVRAEGVLGLVRAFLFAGSPRVLASLWDVDDEATLAWMRVFYARWKAGAGAAAALRDAQARVRADPRWEHPQHWAAWTLWGLPD